MWIQHSSNYGLWEFFNNTWRDRQSSVGAIVADPPKRKTQGAVPFWHPRWPFRLPDKSAHGTQLQHGFPLLPSHFGFSLVQNWASWEWVCARTAFYFWQTLSEVFFLLSLSYHRRVFGKLSVCFSFLSFKFSSNSQKFGCRKPQAFECMWMLECDEVVALFSELDWE